MKRKEHTRALRYKRPALASLGYEALRQELWDISEACTDVHWFIERDDDTLLNALDGDEEAEWEFKMAFEPFPKKRTRKAEKKWNNPTPIRSPV